MNGAERLRRLALPAAQWQGRTARRAAIAAAFLLASVPSCAIAADVATAVYGAAIAPASLAADERMLVESDQIVYDYDNDTVSAVGNVRIYYGAYTLEAERVTYNQSTGRLVASGQVRLIDPTGATFYSEHVDITDDFRDGFVQSLRVDTPQRTYFTAARAERQQGETTTFVDGAYTACEPCTDQPEKPPLWNVRAAKIVVNHNERMVYFTDAKLEFFGMPVAWLPYFAMPDPSVSRKSGFLMPAIGYSAKLGFSGSLPYYWAVAPNADLTITPTVYTKQGFLGQAEWRHRVAHGQYTIAAAGINQRDKDAFDPASASYRDLRGGVRTTGVYHINQDWTLGWDATLSSDRTFTRDYRVLNGDTSETISTVHLTGLSDRNYLEARASHFQVLTETSAAPIGDPGKYDQGRQALVTPVVDYRRVADHAYLGGEVSLTSNVTTLTRSEDDPFEVDATNYFHGTEGTFVRATKELAWQRRVVGPMGQVITPFASVRGDVFFLDQDTAAAITGDGTVARVTPAVGVEFSLPVLVSDGASTQIIEPRAQLIVRPDEMGAGTLPNNDAQSLVFDVSNLFDRDKFSGYDRVEGGTRLNVGVQYRGTFANGISVDGTIGQSIHLLGDNPYDAGSDPIANVGPVSGLETRFSDIVAGLTVDTGFGPRIAARGRFDESTLDVNRMELEATAAMGPVTASAAYLYLRDNPNSEVTAPASVVHGAASINLAENWRAFGSFAYDVASSAIASDSFGVAFDNECLTISLAYSETRESYTDIEPDRWLNFRLQLRTLGEASGNANLASLTN